MGFQLVVAEFDRRVAEAGYPGLRPLHGMAFQALRGPGATSSELAERLGVTKQAAGQLVKELEQRGYVARRPHPAGGRRRLVVLTDSAERHLEVAGRVIAELEAELALRTGQADLGVLRAELTALVHAMSDGSPPPLRPVW
ncbi:MarR family winged helix-turn-helix transcriptional regulator [Streptomyces zhaozhouensis]